MFVPRSEGPPLISSSHLTYRFETFQQGLPLFLQHFTIWAKLPSARALNLDGSTFLSSGKGLIAFSVPLIITRSVHAYVARIIKEVNRLQFDRSPGTLYLPRDTAIDGLCTWYDLHVTLTLQY